MARVKVRIQLQGAAEMGNKEGAVGNFHPLIKTGRNLKMLFISESEFVHKLYGCVLTSMSSPRHIKQGNFWMQLTRLEPCHSHCLTHTHTHTPLMMSFYRRWDFSSLCLLLEFLTVGLLVCASVILTCTTWCKAVGWQPECLMIAECERGCLSSLARGTEKLCHSSVDKRVHGGAEAAGEQIQLLTQAELRHVSQMLTLLSKILVFSASLWIIVDSLCGECGSF